MECSNTSENILVMLASGVSIVVDHSHLYPKVAGSSPDAPTVTEKRKQWIN
jgi:hypothetical protein